MSRILRLFAILTLATLTLAAAACSGGDDDGDSGANETAAAATIGDSDEETPAAAGDDDGEEPEGGDLATYFTSLEEILVRSDDEQEAIGNSLNSLSSDDPEYVTAVQEGLQESISLADDSLAEISELDPTDDAEDAHQEYLAGLTEAFTLLSDLSESIDEATTPAEIDSALAEYNPRISDENEQNEGLCLALQDIADANNIGVDLQCTT